MNNVSDFVKMIAKNYGVDLTDHQLKELTNQLLRDENYIRAHSKLEGKILSIMKTATK